jgi:hypothetical protein
LEVPRSLSSLDAFIAYQEAGIVASFNGPDLETWTPHAVMAAGFASFRDAEVQLAMRDHTYGASSQWLPLGRRRFSSVRVLVDGMTNTWELWARANYRSHRSAFAQFLMLFGLPPAIDDRLDVDHLFARSRIRSVSDGVVRLVLVDRSANRAWGSWLERLEVGWDPGKPRHAVRAVQVAKAIGIAPPAGPVSTVDLEPLHRKLVRHGLDLTIGELQSNFTMARRRQAGDPAGLLVLRLEQSS